MFRKVFTVAALAALSTAALADDITVAPAAQLTRSRAEVQAEAAAFKAAGVNPWSTSFNPLKSFRSDKTRAQVEAELQQYQGSGQAERDRVANAGD